MKKKFFLLASIISISVLAMLWFWNASPKTSTEQLTYQKTTDLSKEYLRLRLSTDDVLLNAKQYEYNEWNDKMTTLIQAWGNLEKESLELEKLATEMAEEKVSFYLVPKAVAYDKQEISDVFDKAPAGKKIRTLAKFLGIDAKRAFKILQNDQEMLKADAWNEAGDTFQKLETSAVVIKDGCKVAGFVGGVIITGGASGFAAAGVVTKTAVVVAGADLILEITEDGANIALGNNNKVSEIVGDVRKITEPAAAILAITDLPENVVKNIDKLNVVIFGVDQFRSTVQDGKIIGIKLPSYEKGQEGKEIEAVVLDEEEIDERLEEEGHEREDGTAEELLNEDEDEMDEDEDEMDEDEDEMDEDEMDSNNINTSKSLEGTYDGVLAGDSLEGLIMPATITVKEGKVSGSIYYSTIFHRGEIDIPFELDLDITGVITSDGKLQSKFTGVVVITGDKPDTIDLWGTIAGPFTKEGGIVDLVGEFDSSDTEGIQSIDPIYIVFTKVK